MVNSIRQIAQMYDTLPGVSVSKDPKDDFLLALAQVSQSDFLVTGDKSDLLDPLRKEYGDRNRDRTQDEKQSLLGVNEHRSPSLTTSSDARRTFAAGLV